MTYKEVASNFEITPRKLIDIVRDPTKVGRQCGHPTRLNHKEELVIVRFIVQRRHCHMYTSIHLII